MICMGAGRGSCLGVDSFVVIDVNIGGPQGINQKLRDALLSVSQGYIRWDQRRTLHGWLHSPAAFARAIAPITAKCECGKCGMIRAQNDL
jgi:hypothetical protein